MLFRKTRLRLAASPASRVLRGYYEAALAALELWCRRHPAIESLLLSGSGASGRLRYGMSDLDIWVVQRDDEVASVRKERFLTDLRNLHRLFPLVSIGPHDVVFTREEFDELVMRRSPHYFSIPGYTKVLFTRDPSRTYSIPYALEHERSFLSYLWQKIDVLLENRTEVEEYGSYLRGCIAEYIGDARRRLGIEGVAPEAPTNGALVRQLIELHRVVLDRIAGGERGEVPLPAPGSTRAIPNVLLWETLPLAEVFSSSVMPERLVVQMARDRSLAEQVDEYIGAYGRSDADLFGCGGLLLPLPRRDRSTLEPLDPAANPVTFASLRADCEPLDMWQAAERCLATGAFTPAVRSMNEYLLRSLERDPNPLFAIRPENLPLAELALGLWRAGADDASGRERLRDVLARSSDRSASERLFVMKNLVQRRSADPAPVRATVAIVTRNRADLLVRAISSLRSQTFEPAEIVIVDNGSTDHTAEVVRAWAERWGKIRYVYERQPGIPHARNRALAESSERSDVIAFLDDDCIARSRWLEELVLPFRYDPEVVSAGGYVQFDQADKTVWGDFYCSRNGTSKVLP